MNSSTGQSKSKPVRASYRDAIDWIAQNDSPGESDALDVEPVSELVSTCLVSDVWRKPPEEVARDVIRRRKQLTRLGSPKP